MDTQTPQELALAEILVDVLDLEDVEATDILPSAPLFGFENPDSLGLDSIDALEIALAIAKHYDVQLKADDEKNKEIFFSLRSLSDHISANTAG